VGDRAAEAVKYRGHASRTSKPDRPAELPEGLRRRLAASRVGPGGKINSGQFGVGHADARLLEQ
jgi:hypothetical protein